MTKHIEYRTSGTCSRMIVLDVTNDVITDCKFIGGCPGNTFGVSTLVKGMPVSEAIAKLSGIRCGGKPTSCPDQLACALKSAMETEEV